MSDEIQEVEPPTKKIKHNEDNSTKNNVINEDNELRINDVDFSNDVDVSDSGQSYAINDKYTDYVTSEELDRLREFKVLDETKSNDEDSNDEDSDSSDGKSVDVPDEEIEQMLDDNLPEELKTAPKPKEKPYVTRQKIVLEDKGLNQIEVLPLDWVMARHYSGMPIYMNRTTRVCTLSKPYFLPKGNIRKHEIPISAIPCLAYRRALEEEEKQQEIDKKIQEQIKNGTWREYTDLNDNAEGNRETNALRAKFPFLNGKIIPNNKNIETAKAKCPYSKGDAKSNDSAKDNTHNKGSTNDHIDLNIDKKDNENACKVSISNDAECKDNINNDNECKDNINYDDDSVKDLTCDKLENETDINDFKIKIQIDEGNSNSDEMKDIKTSEGNENINENNENIKFNEINENIELIKSKEMEVENSSDVSNSNTNNNDNSNEETPSTSQQEDGATKEIPLFMKPVVLPGGIVMPPPRVENVATSWKTQHLTHEQVNEYCRKLFKFKTINIMHFKRWADRRKYTKARKTLQYPTLPEGTKLITIPIQKYTQNGQENGGKPHKRDWVMNMDGRSYLSVFHEYVCRVLHQQPVYEFKQLENASSPYQATVLIGGMQYGVGRGSSKRAAKSAAARASIHVLIPEMRDLEGAGGQAGQGGPGGKGDPDCTFFDYVGIEDPRVPEFCAAACEPSPYAVLRTCLLRNFGAGDRHIHTQMKKMEDQEIELVMRVGKHSAAVVCKNKKTAKQRASQRILQALHPQVRSWGSLLRLYGSRSVKSCKEKKLEEQQITLLQDSARHNEPNYAVLEKLRNEMRKLRERDDAVVPIGTLLVTDDLPTHSGSNLNNVDL